MEEGAGGCLCGGWVGGVGGLKGVYGPCRQGVCEIIQFLWFILNALPRPNCRYIYGLDEASQDQLEQQQRAIVGR